MAICLHCLDMRDFHSYLRDTPFLDSLRSNAVFIPLSRALGHHSVDSLNAEKTGGLKAKAGVGQYAATKRALKAFADSLRDEVNEYGVRVNQHLSWSDCESHVSTAVSDGAEDLRAREAPPAVGCGGGRSVRAESADKRGGERNRGAPHVQSPPRVTTLNTPGSTKQPKKIAFFGHFGVDNFGDESTLQAVLCHLRRVVPNAEFNCICTDPSTAAMTYDIAAVPFRAPVGEYTDERLKQLSELRVKGLISPQEYQQKRAEILRTLHSPLARLARRLVGDLHEPWQWVESIRTLWGTDALIVPGTGVLTDAVSLYFWGPYDLFRWSIAARLCRCKILFVSVGAGPLYSRAGRFFVKTALPLADFRSYRDESSLRYLEGIGFRAGNDPVYPDLAFSLPESLIPRGHDGEGRRPVVGLGLMEYAGTISLERPDTSVYSAYLEALVEFTEWLLAHEYDVRLLIGDRVDTHVKQEFKSLLKKRSVMYGEERIIDEPIASVDDLLKQVAATDVVVATRFHNVLLALLLNKPVIAISFHHKCTSLMSQMGLSEYCQDINRLSSVRLIEQFSQLRQSSDGVKRMITEKVRACRDALDEQYAVILSEICSE